MRRQGAPRPGVTIRRAPGADPETLEARAAQRHSLPSKTGSAWCAHMERLFMDPTNAIKYGLATPEQVAGKTGREILQAIIDGELPQPPIAEIMSFWITEVGRLRRLRRRARPALAQPNGRRPWRLGIDAHRQRGGLRRVFATASRVRLRHGRDQGQFCAADHQGHGAYPPKRAWWREAARSSRPKPGC